MLSMDRFSMDFPWRPVADKKCGRVWGGGSPPHEEAKVWGMFGQAALQLGSHQWNDCLHIIDISPWKICVASWASVKTEKTCFSAKKQYVASYGDSGLFDTTEWSGNIFCVEIDPGSPIFCLTE